MVSTNDEPATIDEIDDEPATIDEIDDGDIILVVEIISALLCVSCKFTSCLS